MRHLLTSTLLLCFGMFASHPTWGQNEAPKYLMAEHFTNTLCSICPSRNPGFFGRKAEYPGWIHIISYHPAVPYPTDIFNNQNPTENEARRAHFNVNATPQAFLYGVRSNKGADLLPTATIEANYQQTSPFHLSVSQQIVDNTLQTSVEIETFKAYTPTESGNYRLYVAVIEKVIDYNAPNGEQKHDDVFRKMLTDVSGDVIAVAPVGASVGGNFQISIDSNWNTDELAVVAFLTHEGNEVTYLNSGQTGDLSVKMTSKAATNQDGSATVLISGGQPPYTITWNDPNNQATETATNLAPGDYMATVTDANDITIRRTITVSGATSISTPLPDRINIFEYQPGFWQLEGLTDPQARILLINSQGQTSLQVPSVSPTGFYRFNTTPLPSGIYVMQILTEDQLYWHKILVR